MSEAGFSFESGNLGKLLAIPKYLLSMLFALFVPRNRKSWVFGSGIGVAEGALALALELQSSETDARITWIVSDDGDETEAAELHGFAAAKRASWSGYWATLRARHAVITHGLGDVNRFGVTGARIIHLGHGAPLKKLHLDSPVTTEIKGSMAARALLRRMYLVGSQRIALYVAGSITAAERLRTAYRVAPGKVRVLGDPRDDELALQAQDPRRCVAARTTVLALLGLAEETAEPEKLILYAPTWRDGDTDPAVPSVDEAVAILSSMQNLDARLIIRSHPLGAGAYESVLGDRVHELPNTLLRDITPVLGAFDAVITDFSSIAVDFALLGRPIVWLAPDLERYTAVRGLYEPLEVTAVGQVMSSWESALRRLELVLADDSVRQSAHADTRALASRFHAHSEGGAAKRVLAEIRRLDTPPGERIGAGAVFFESFYGRQVSCNPLAIDREIARRHPEIPRYWSVVSERIVAPEGATPVLVGGPDWFAARRRARLLVVNDWLRYGFRRRRGQAVLQTWHGTMLKHLALGRPNVGLRTRLAIRRESRRWSLLLSQNAHSTEQFRRSYAFAGEILELGYPRDDRLAKAMVASTADAGTDLTDPALPALPVRMPQAIREAKRALGIPAGLRVLAYAPTWREAGPPSSNFSAVAGGNISGGANTSDGAALDVSALARELGEGWAIIVRGHTRTRGLGNIVAPWAVTGSVSDDSTSADSASGGSGIDDGMGSADGAVVIDVSNAPDVNDLILAADLLVTDYSSLMFDAAVACVPMAFFVPDLAEYRDRERGFTLDFERLAPGPLMTVREQLVAAAKTGFLPTSAYAAWRERFTPFEDGDASRRVVDALEARGFLGA